MIHIILMILKVIGILILALLGLLLFLFLAMLFVPFTYRMRIKKDSETLEGKVGVSWLAYLIWVQIAYLDKRVDLDIRILGVSIKHLKKVKEFVGKFLRPIISFFRRIRSRRKKPIAEKPEDKLNPMEEMTTDWLPKDQIEPKTKKRQEDQSFWARIKKILSRILSIPSAISGFFSKMYLTIRGTYGRIKKWKMFLTADNTQKALKFLLGKGKSLFRHMRPRKVRGNLKFGFDDPWLTGQVLAGISVAYPIYKEKLKITPVFNDSILEGDLFLRGHVLGVVLLKIFWDIYRNRDVKTIIRKFQHKEA